MKKSILAISMLMIISKAYAGLLTGLLVGGTVGYLMGGSSDKKETIVIYERNHEEECKQKVYHYNKDKTIKSVECIK